MVNEEISKKQQKHQTNYTKIDNGMEIDEEDGGGQALYFNDDQEVIEIADDDDIKNNNNNDEETGEEHVTEKGIVVKTMKDGKTMLIFLGDQKEMATEMTANIRKKLEHSKKKEICDFQVL